MNKYSYILILVLILTLPSFTHAESEIEIETKGEVNPFLGFLGFEAMFAINSWLASENPNAYGGIAALLFPLAGSSTTSDTTYWVSLAAVESLAIYNLQIDEDKETKSEIFKNNMVAWHLVAAIVGVTDYIMGDFESNKSLTLSPLPKGGAQLSFNFKF